MAAGRQSPTALRQWLVRLGHLYFDDFLLLAPETLDPGHWTPELASDWTLATNNAPHVELRFRSANCSLQPAACELTASPPSLVDVLAAQQRLVTHFAYELLRAKAPPLYDSLPWHDWDFSIVTKRFRLWQTRFLLAGDGTTATMCRCRKSAGVYIVEPEETIARYIELKCAKQKVRRLKLLRAGLDCIPLPDNSVDLAVFGSVPSLDTGDWKLATREATRVSHNVLLVENNPLLQSLDEKSLMDSGLQPASVAVSGFGQRRCWWRTSSA